MTRKSHPEPVASESVQMLYEKGRQCVKEMDYHQAATFFARSLQLDPDHLPTLAAFALIMYTTNRIQRALPLYQAALKLSPNNPAILTGIGNCYGAEGDFAKATDHYERALYRP